MTRHPTPLPDDLGESFTVHQARAAGVTEKRLRHPSLRAPFRGVRVQPAAEPAARASDESPTAREARLLVAEIIRQAHALAKVMPDHWFFSHVSAAVLWGLPVPLRILRRAVADGRGIPPRGIDVAALGAHRASKAAGVRGHQLSPKYVTVQSVDGLRVASPASTWAMLADELSVDELVELGDAIVFIPRMRGMKRGTERDALSTLARLRAAATVPRRAHRIRLLEAIDLVRVGSASPSETRIRLACMRAGLPEPELDFDVYTADGTAVGFTEFAFPDYKLLIESEGDHHRVDRAQWYRDIDKHTACEDAGWRVLRLAGKHVYPTAEPAVARITAALRRAGWRP